MANLKRRGFLQSCLTAGTGWCLSSPSLAAIEPIRRQGKPHLRLSMAAYSYHRYLHFEGRQTAPMTLDDFIDGAAGMDLDAVELTAYYFPRTSPDYLAHLKGKCTLLGLDVSGTAIGNDFCVQDPAKLREQIAYVRQWVEHSSRLGAK